MFTFLDEVKTYAIRQDYTLLPSGATILSVCPSLMYDHRVRVEFHLDTPNRPRTGSLALTKEDCVELSRHFSELATALS